jgi:2-phosphoglycerate kinase
MPPLSRAGFDDRSPPTAAARNVRPTHGRTADTLIAVTERPWDVLLVGGPSGAGKSSLAYPLARELGIPVLEIDDIVCALQALTTPEHQSELFYWQTHPEALAAPADEIMRHGIALAAALEPALAAIVGNHLETDMPVVIEGDFLRPSFTIQSGYAGQSAGTRVRGIFVLEDDPAQIVANYAAREPDAGDQMARADVSVAWSRWLAEEAQRYAVPTIASRPWADLIARAQAALGGS